VWRALPRPEAKRRRLPLSCANLAVRGILKLACLGGRAQGPSALITRLGEISIQNWVRCLLRSGGAVLGPAWASTNRAAFRRRYPLNGLKLTLKPCEFGFSVLDTRQFGSSLGSSFCCLGELLAAELLVIQGRNIDGG
jgi:hypothetical protein